MTGISHTVDGKERSMERRPNILLITTDQQRTDSLGCYGSTFIRTPNIDEIAGAGTRFEQCYVNNPICTPSRASLYTGRPLAGHGVFQLHDILPEDVPTFPSLLQQEGYHTALFGKLHISGRSYEQEKRNLNDGYDIYEQSISAHNQPAPYNAYANWLEKNHPDYLGRLEVLGRNITNVPEEVHYTTWCASRTIDFIRDCSQLEAPFFCHMSIVDPHDPYNDYPHSALAGLDILAIPAPYAAGEEVHRLPWQVVDEHEHSYLGSIHALTAEQIMEMRKGYYASVAYLDTQIGRVVKALKETGQWENTAIVFTSDHGDMLGDHGLLGKGAYFFDETTRVPLIVRVPGESGLKVDRRLVQLHDVAAALLHLGGASGDRIRQMMPQSLDLLNEAVCRDIAVCAYRNTGICDQKVYRTPPFHSTMVRAGRYKMNVYHNAGLEPGIHGELYDMEADPKEMQNLWAEEAYALVRMDLLLRLIDWFVENETVYASGRGGSQFPDRSQWLNLNIL